MIRRGGQLKYRRIADELESFLAKAKPGDKLPPERDLAESFACNVLTVRKALAPLSESGRIVRRSGSGSFVADPAKAPFRSPKADLEKVGLFLHAKCDAYGMYVVKAIHEAATAMKAKISMACIDAFDASALEIARGLRREGCASAFVSWAPFDEVGSLASFVRNAPLPVCVPTLLAGLEDRCYETPAVYGAGSMESLKLICEFFFELGERRIALLGPEISKEMAMKDRLAGYAECVCNHGLESLVKLVGPSAEDMDAAAKSLAPFKGELAVLCYDDVHALRFMTAMHRLGLSAPRDFRIIGNNDIAESKFSDPPLASARPNYAHLGRIALRSALALGRGEIWRSEKAVLNVLTVRASCHREGRIPETTLKKMNLAGLEIDVENSVAPAKKEAVPCWR